MTRVEELLLNRNATEVSYKYIESLLVERVKAESLFSPSENDPTEDLVDLLEGCLQRSGSGWVMVVADRISSEIVLATLLQIQKLEINALRVIDALSRLLCSFPVIAICQYDGIMREILRLMKLASCPSVVIARLAGSLLSARKPSNGIFHTICTLSLYHLSVVNDSLPAEAVIELLNNCTEYLCRDYQMVSTCLGLSDALLAKFPENRDIRRLVGVFRSSFTSPKNATRRDESIIDVERDIEEDKIQQASHMEQNINDEASSPRSSCPSLE